MNTEIFKKLNDFLSAIPAGIPVVGHIYSDYLSSEDIKELKALVTYTSNMSRADHTQLVISLGELSDRFVAIENSFKENTTQRDEKLTVVIPCGGNGGSLFPMTQVMPKCLVLVNNKPLLQHILDSFLNQKDVIKSIIITTAKHHDAIVHSVKQGGYGDFVKCINVPSTSVSDTLLKISSEITTTRFVLHYNDILTPKLDWKHTLANYDLNRKIHNQIGALLCSSYYPLAIGLITEKNNEPGLLKDFKEKPRYLDNKLANMGVAIFEKIAIEKYCQKADSSFYIEPIERMRSANENVWLHKIGEWFHIQDWNSLYDLQNTNNYYNP